MAHDVTGLSRKSEWVADDLLNHLDNVEESVKAKLESYNKVQGDRHEHDVCRLQEQRAASYLEALKARDANVQAGRVLNDDSQLRHYIQIVTDTPSVNAKAWGLIENMVPHILANPCSFHCVNLYFTHMLKGDKSDRANQVGPVDVCVEAEQWTKELEQWFTNKEVPRAALKAACEVTWPQRGPRRMRKYSDTRAAIAYRVWHRAVRLKLRLRMAVASTQYTDFENNMKDADEKERAARMREYVADDARFDLLDKIVSALTPVYILLRLVDGYTPSVGKVCYKSQSIDSKLSALATENPNDLWYQSLHEFWVRDWGYLHADLHSLGYAVGPEYHHLMDSMPADFWTEFIRCATRMLKAAPAAMGLDITQLTSEYAKYQNSEPPFTSTVVALAKDRPAHVWWQQWGKSTPSLSFVAQRGLAQTIAASCSEQGWSEYDIVHSRRRNRLKTEYASKLTKGHNQARLIRRVRSIGSNQKFHSWTDSDDDDEEAFFSS